MAKSRVEILDSTLRDGAQSEGVSFSSEDKLRLARAPDGFGVDYVEGGWIGANPKDDAFFAALRAAPLKRAKLVAFGLTCRAGGRPADDPRLRALAESGVGIVSLVGKASALHIRRALRVTEAENRRLIRDSVAYLVGAGKRVFFDAEHFFDGYADNPRVALAALAAAADGGAEALVLCDTNGGGLPGGIAAGVRAARERFPDLTVGIHAHDDAGLALANTLAAIEVGATHAQATLNGLGERCGMTDLCALLPDLAFKLGRRAGAGRKALAGLTALSRLGYALSGQPPRAMQPYVGQAAFAHKGGLHVSALARDTATYEHVPPASVGNGRRVLASELSGRANIAALSPEAAADPKVAARLLAEVRRLEAEGYSFDDAGGSFALVRLRMEPGYEKPFRLHSFRAITDRALDDYGPENPALAGRRVGAGGEAAIPGRALSEASVRVTIGAAELHTVAEGAHGPVNALDAALRKALAHVYPFVDLLRLVDYRVHIVNAEAGVAARVRVVAYFRVGRLGFGTVGVSEDVLAASCRALCDGYEWLIAQKRRRPARRRGRLHKVRSK